ncbi:MAG: hypothetical protein AB7V19_04895, partial [Candidatus Bipolaricaulia bacterium]
MTLADFFRSPLRVANLGLASFAEALRAAGCPVVEVDWRPPAGGDPDLARLLDGLRDETGDRWTAAIERGNKTAVERLLAAQPTLIGIGVAQDVIPGMTADTL